MIVCLIVSPMYASMNINVNKYVNKYVNRNVHQCTQVHKPQVWVQGSIRYVSLFFPVDFERYLCNIKHEKKERTPSSIVMWSHKHFVSQVPKKTINTSSDWQRARWLSWADTQVTSEDM